MVERGGGVDKRVSKAVLLCKGDTKQNDCTEKEGERDDRRKTYGDDGDLASWWEGQLTLGAVVNISGVGGVDFFNESHGVGR